MTKCDNCDAKLTRQNSAVSITVTERPWGQVKRTTRMTWCRECADPVTEELVQCRRPHVADPAASPDSPSKQEA